APSALRALQGWWRRAPAAGRRCRRARPRAPRSKGAEDRARKPRSRPERPPSPRGTPPRFRGPSRPRASPAPGSKRRFLSWSRSWSPPVRRPFDQTRPPREARTHPVHLDEVLPPRDGLRARGRPRPSGGQVELGPARAVRAELEAEQTAFGDPVENDRPGAVAEQDGGAAIAPVEDPGEHVAADDERV